VKAEQTKRKDNNTVRATIALFIVGLLSACLLGCATRGRPYDDGKVAMIKKDVTTEAELVDWFGPPSSRAMGADGAKALRWTFSPGEGRAASSSGRLDVKLGGDGKVTSYSAAAGSK
jgi:hypothetical protein